MLCQIGSWTLGLLTTLPLILRISKPSLSSRVQMMQLLAMVQVLRHRPYYTTLSSPSQQFILKDVLCAPAIHRNGISVPLFFEQNKTWSQYEILLSLLWKRTGALLAQGPLLRRMNGQDPHHQLPTLHCFYIPFLYTLASPFSYSN